MHFLRSRDGAAALYMKPMVNFEKLCDVYASDLAKGVNAKGPGEQEAAEGDTLQMKYNQLVNLLMVVMLKQKMITRHQLLNKGIRGCIQILMVQR